VTSFYGVDSLEDLVIEGFDEGIDSVDVDSSIFFYEIPRTSRTPPGSVTSRGYPRRIIYRRAILGNALDNRITGNDESSNISGLEGNDTIDGARGRTSSRVTRATT